MNEVGAKGDVVYFGVGRHAFAWGERRTVTAEPDRNFQPLKFGAPIGGFVIFAITAAGEELFGNALGVPVELLSEVSTFPQPRWPELGPGRAVAFDVQAPDEPQPQPFKWWQRLWNWITRKKPPALPTLPVFQGAFYGVNR